MARYKLDIQKRQHRERSQPLNRQRLGLLEKHKDYVKRSKDYHSKQDRIKSLRKKASMKNPDEFYFEMINSKTDLRTGIHLKNRSESKPMDNDLVMILKTQDFNYVKTCRAVEEKKVQSLKERLGSIVNEIGGFEGTITENERRSREILRSKISKLVKTDLSVTSSRFLKESEDGSDPSDQEENLNFPKKTIFVDSLDRLKNFIPSSKRSSLRSKSKAKDESDQNQRLEKDQEKHVRFLMKQFRSRLKRLRTLQRAERELELRRNLMSSSGTKKVIEGSNSKKLKKKERGIINGRDLSWYDKLDRKDLVEEEEEGKTKESFQIGIKTGVKVWKWKNERKR